MKNKTIKSVLIGLSLMGVAHQADAEIFTWSFEAVSAGNVSAFVDFDDATSIFTIRDNALNADLAPNAGINGIAFNFDGTFVSTGPVPTSNIGDFEASTTNPALPTGFDVGFIGESNKSPFEVNDGESTTINFGLIAVADIDGVALRFNDNNGAINGDSEWITGVAVVAVPEPETYAMFLAGLGLLGFTARKRKNT